MFVGSYSGSDNQGSSNIFIGNNSGRNSNTSSLSVFIGDQAGRDESNTGILYIENSFSAQPLIYGQFFQDKVEINWDSTIDPPSNLSVNGTIYISETAKLEPLSAAPSCSTGDMGKLYVDTNGNLNFCDGTMWKTVQVN